MKDPPTNKSRKFRKYSLTIKVDFLRIVMKDPPTIKTGILK